MDQTLQCKISRLARNSRIQKDNDIRRILDQYFIGILDMKSKVPRGVTIIFDETRYFFLTIGEYIYATNLRRLAKYISPSDCKTYLRRVDCLRRI